MERNDFLRYNIDTGMEAAMDCRFCGRTFGELGAWTHADCWRLPPPATTPRYPLRKWLVGFVVSFAISFAACQYFGAFKAAPEMQAGEPLSIDSQERRGVTFQGLRSERHGCYLQGQFYASGGAHAVTLVNADGTETHEVIPAGGCLVVDAPFSSWAVAAVASSP